MACYSPMAAFQRADTGEVSLRERRGFDKRLRLPCGGCIGCRLDKARDWSVRCQHEARLYDHNSFLTLTYDDEHLPPFGSLRYRDCQLFLKRLRKRFVGLEAGPSGKSPIRFFLAGEYGEHTDRAHYHVLLFNFDFADKVPIGDTLSESATLSELWPHGHSAVGAVSPASAAYVSQYSLKKVHGRAAGEVAYSVVDLGTGEVGERAKEFCVMSRRPGIGAWWFERFGRDCLPRDYVVVDGQKLKVPRYYSERFERDNPEAMLSVREARELAAFERGDDSWSRLGVRAEVARARVQFFNSRGSV